MKTKDEQIMCRLIGQVSAAYAALRKVTTGPITEADILTVISRPMWRAWCRATGSPENTKPTAWLGIGKTHRVYGSETRVVNSRRMWSYSLPRNNAPTAFGH